MRMLDDVGERLGDGVVRRRLHRFGQAFRERDVELDREGCSGRQHLERGPESALGEDCRMDPLCELAQLGDRLGELLRELFEQLVGFLRAGAQLALRDPEPDRQRHQSLLSAVVQVALDAATFSVAGLDDALARRGQLVARARARDGKPDKLGERLQAALGLERKGFLRLRATTRAPQVTPATVIGTPTLPENPSARSLAAPGPARSS